MRVVSSGSALMRKMNRPSCAPRKPLGLHYDIKGADDDEAGYRFSDERFVVGEYVSIHEAEGFEHSR